MKLILCPKCGKLLSPRFPIHYCERRPSVAKKPVIAKTYKEAMSRMPIRCLVALEHMQTGRRVKKVQDIIDAVNLELSMWEEGQEGCLSPFEASACIKFLRWIKS